MNWNHIVTVYLKELKDSLRDRRTLISMIVVPTLLTWPGSAIIHDIKGENWELTAGWRARFSHCLLFDPTRPSSSRSMA